MLSVCIFVNDKLIVQCNAVNVTYPWRPDNKLHTYKIWNGDKIKHRRIDGPEKLAIKMLKRMKNSYGR